MYILLHMMTTKRARRAYSTMNVPQALSVKEPSTLQRPESAPPDIGHRSDLKNDSEDSDDENKQEDDDNCVKVTRTHTITHKLDTYVHVSYESSSTTLDESVGSVIKRTYTKDQGTPHGCITTLIRYVINALDNIPKGSKKTPLLVNYNDKLKNLPPLDIRSKLSKHGTEIQESLEPALNAIYTSTGMTTEKKNILKTEFWAAILNKSISDVSQCGALVNNIQYLKNTSSSSSSSRIIKTKLEESPTTAFLSSDAIAAAVSSLVLREINHPIPTLCSRKAHNISQTIILQKSEISALAVMLKYAGNQHKNELYDLLTYYSNHVIHETRVDLSDIITLYTDIVQKIPDLCNDLQKVQDEFYNKDMANDFIQQKVDYIFSPDHLINDETRGRYQSSLCNFISNIITLDKRDAINATLIKFANILKQIAEVDDDKSKYIIIPRWTYHISSDMFKYMFSDDIDYKPEVETKVGRAEMIAATYDATYGHDYYDISRTDKTDKIRHSVIQDLGEDFLEIMNELPPVLPRTDIKVKNEDQCIEAVLDTTNFSSINQVSSKFEVSFCSRNNHLKIKPELMKLKDTEINWKIGESVCIFPKNVFIASIDFVRGEPSVAPLRAAQKNTSMEYAQEKTVTKVDVVDFIKDNDTARKLDSFEEIVEKTRLRELRMAPHDYDGAGSYNGFPIAIVSDSTAVPIVPKTKHTSMCRLNDKITLTIETTTQLSNIKATWMNKTLTAMKYRPGFHSKKLLEYVKMMHINDPYLEDIPTDNIEFDQVKESFSNLLNSIWKSNVLINNISSILDDIDAVYRRLGYGRPSRNTEVDNASRLIAKNIAKTFRDKNSKPDDYIKSVRDIIERKPPQDVKPLTDNDCPPHVPPAEAIGDVFIYVIKKLKSESVPEHEKMLLSDMLSTAMNISIEGEASGRSLRFTAESPISGPAKKKSAGPKPVFDASVLQLAHKNAEQLHNLNQVDLKDVRSKNVRIPSRGPPINENTTESQPAFAHDANNSPIRIANNNDSFVPTSEPRTLSRNSLFIPSEDQSEEKNAKILAQHHKRTRSGSDPEVGNPDDIMNASDTESNEVPSSAEMGNKSSEDEMSMSQKSESSIDNYMQDNDDDEVSIYSDIIPIPSTATATGPISSFVPTTIRPQPQPASSQSEPLRRFGRKPNIPKVTSKSDWESIVGSLDSGFHNPQRGGGTRKLRHKYKRKHTHRKPVQRKRKRTRRNAAQRKRNNNTRTRRRR